MNIKEIVRRVIDQRTGNHVLEIEGMVFPDDLQTVLPVGHEYVGEVVGIRMFGGSILFTLKITAQNSPEPMIQLTPIAEVSLGEQERAYLYSQLENSGLSTQMKDSIRQRLGISPEYQDVIDKKKNKL